MSGLGLIKSITVETGEGKLVYPVKVVVQDGKSRFVADVSKVSKFTNK